ncbi:unnamed protein product [Heterobilharzia americana]|nr:unnamed protein product [Heterobilharzia americana]
MLSSVEFYHEKQQDSANYQINKPKEMCDTFVDQTIPEEIHPKNESDDYSSDFSETHSSVSLDALTPELTKPYSAYKPNSVTPKLSAGTEIHDTENCEYVSTGQRVRCALLIDQITDRSDKKNNNVIRFKQSDNLLFHQHVHSRVKRRANDLFKLIDLSLDQLINVFELKPIDCYEFLMPRSNEYRNRIHRQVQTNDDALDREVQTEPIDVCHGVWTQQPANENGDFYGRDSSNNYFPSKIPYDLTDDASMKTVLGELTREFCLGTNTCSAVIEDTNNIANILFADESKLSTNYNFKNSNNCSQLPDSFSEYLYLMLDILNEENLASTTYLFKNCSKNDNEFESDGSDYVEILFHSTVSPFSYETDDDSQKIPSTTAVPNGDFNSVNVGETYKPNNASSFWENYECVACECAPQNQSVILTIHRPVKLSQGHELEHCFNSSTRAGEFICIWTAIGSKHLPDRLLYCPGLSETGLKGSNLNCAIFSPDKDASLVIAGLCNGSLSIWDLHNYSSEILMKPTNFVIYDDNNPCRFGSINGFKNSGLPVAFPPTYITSAVEVTDFATMNDSKSVDNFYIKQSSHFNPIISIKIADFNQQLEYSSGVIEITKNVDRFQFVALDDVGNLSLWLVLMIGGANYGLSPGKGWIRLIRLLFIENKLTHHVPTYLNENPSKYRADKQTNESSNKTIATCLAVARHGTFLIGCSNGKIVHRRRSSSQIVYPKLFSRILCCAAVQTIAVHPNESLHLFLAGYADGKICLYKNKLFPTNT